jgi:hypothetical protein
VPKRVTPPRPDLIRRPDGRFGWLEDRLLRDGWLQRLGPEALAVLVLLALAADRNGCSFFGRQRMADALGLRRHNVDAALARLLQLRLVAHRPWRTGDADGVWQLLPLPLPATLPQARPKAALPTPPHRNARRPQPEGDEILRGQPLQDLIKSLAAAHGFPVIHPVSPTRAERRNDALPERQ